jgi:sodium-dependent phosphate cotransporter
LTSDAYNVAITKVDGYVGQLLAATQSSAAEWSALVCADSSSTETSNSSSIMQLAPELLTAEGFDEDDIDTSEPLTCLETVWYSFLALVFLYLFLFGLSLMGTSFKVLGGKSAGNLFTSIDNPIAGLMVGILATVLVQSSSTSTSVVVGMVGADIIPVKTAIPIIMGANIGTSVTNTIVSMGQMGVRAQYKRAFSGATVHDCFNVLCVLTFLPIEIITGMLYHWTEYMTSNLDGEEGGKFKSPLKIIVSPLTKLFLEVDKKKVNKIAEGKLTADTAGHLTKGGWFSHENMDEGLGGGLCLTISLIILCLALAGIVHVLQKLAMGSAKECIRSSLKFTDTWWGGYIAMLVGVGCTIAVQSSSITTSTLTPLVGIGIITLEQMLPLTLGANIGTTCTGLLAAMVSAKRNALQIALVHLSFNCFGIIVWYPCHLTRQVPLNMARMLGSLAWHFKWFPLAYIASVFVLIPLVALGISQLFSAGPAGVAFGIISIVILVGLIGWAWYAYYYQGGGDWLIELAGEAGETNIKSSWGEDEEVATEMEPEEKGKPANLHVEIANTA